ncbi:MAG: hypothetical protein A3G37_03175 [Omnitrophica WOR_2 bacterium RIFCSPLOWO2_12_FULL_46_30]|nr:MAG: hypothetical protein A3G37_03175 [Omnitrophica WOR_2 bacterium RIFCSPLOWO2_12_FULL_46_30]
MGNKTKGPVILLFFLLLVAIAAAVLGFIGLQNEKQINAALTQEKEEIEIKKKAAEKEVSNLKQQVDGLLQEKVLAQAKIQEFNSRIASLDEELSAEKKAKEDTLLEAEKLREEVITLKNAKSKLEVDLKASNETIGSLKGKLATLEASGQKKEGEQKAQGIQSQDMQLEKIVIASQAEPAQASLGEQAPSSPPGTGPKPPPGEKSPSGGKPGTALLEGKVLVVNKEYDFVVVNIGQKDNLTIGDSLEVSRKEKKLGELKVEEVRDTMSVAIPVEPNLVKQIKENDRVVRK